MDTHNTAAPEPMNINHSLLWRHFEGTDKDFGGPGRRKTARVSKAVRNSLRPKCTDLRRQRL